jgi:hypothetical protein
VGSGYQPWEIFEKPGKLMEFSLKNKIKFWRGYRTSIKLKIVEFGKKIKENLGKIKFFIKKITRMAKIPRLSPNQTNTTIQETVIITPLIFYNRWKS